MHEGMEIERPEKKGIDEDTFFKFEMDDLTKHYDEVFVNGKKRKDFLKRWTFRLVLLADKNVILILAGSGV